MVRVLDSLLYWQKMKSTRPSNTKGCTICKTREILEEQKYSATASIIRRKNQKAFNHLNFDFKNRIIPIGLHTNARNKVILKVHSRPILLYYPTLDSYPVVDTSQHLDRTQNSNAIGS